MTTDVGEARNWRSREGNCGACSYLLPKKIGWCWLVHTCIDDRDPHRLDRLFSSNPELANACIAHPDFEVRAIAANYANLFLLPPLLDDEDGAVRWTAARRLPKRYMLRLRTDPDRKVRIRVANLLDSEDLMQMLADEDSLVRGVARRIPYKWLLGMPSDPDALVRLDIAQRLVPDSLSALRRDRDWRVRYEVASRIETAELAGITEDKDSMVREVARGRLALCPELREEA
ncbi:4Fe4S-binding leucine-rich repeat protein [Bradyrhizobium sp. Tv2a-2]|uniref:4Fe4S-binding leucine-rich repeat protein n=1 Tax=Bradyrhizobium sp. Tv2a-2 TaxID=113395 RepID=UPI000467A776|nr:4Fe4S-binding leucine-rich repeat protein [Bradyrhizobium sp. Tv2a-2]